VGLGHRDLHGGLALQRLFGWTEGLGLDAVAWHAEVEQDRPQSVHHCGRAAEMDTATGEVGDCLRNEFPGQTPCRPHPNSAFHASHGGNHVQVGVPALEVFEFLTKHKILSRAAAAEQLNVVEPAAVGEVADDTDQGCEPDATADEDDTIRFGAGEGKGTLGRGNLEAVESSGEAARSSWSRPSSMRVVPLCIRS
jgi:hypothetical protein